tara:strand:- start:111 stop:914 length:804 start_codon:yes stop_codon:yes gene_type:complete
MNFYIIFLFIIGIFLFIAFKKYMKKMQKKSSGYSVNLISKYREIAKTENKVIIHCMHIGKTGGTAIKFAMNLKGSAYIDDKYIIVGHRHSFSLKDVLPDEKCFFFVRDPIDRFISSFYSRKRKGMPRIYREWNKGEKKAFSKFNTPNELARALNSEDLNIKNDAIDAMKNIHHVKTSFWDWFISKEYFLSRKDDILFIGNQKKMDSDFIKLKNILELPDHFSLPRDPVKMHKNPEGIDKNLDDNAIKNLKSWYAKDYEFLDIASSLN